MLYTIRDKILKILLGKLCTTKTNANVNNEPNMKRFFEENVKSNSAKVKHYPFLPRRQHISKTLSLVLKV